jgi:hypothetical protein
LLREERIDLFVHGEIGKSQQQPKGTERPV